MDSRRDQDSAHADALLHARLMACDPVAPAELAERYLDDLARWANRLYGYQDAHLVQTCAIDAVLELVQHAERYDPTQSSLAAYLRMSVRGDILNALSSERRRHRHLDAVEVSERARNLPDEHSPDPAELVVNSDTLSEELRALLDETFNAIERRVVQLMMEGERRTAVYAGILGLTELSDTERARTVKQVKDRLQKRLQRLAPKVTRDV